MGATPWMPVVTVEGCQGEVPAPLARWISATLTVAPFIVSAYISMYAR